MVIVQTLLRNAHDGIPEWIYEPNMPMSMPCSQV